MRRQGVLKERWQSRRAIKVTQKSPSSPGCSQKSTLRNLDGVAFKLMNLRAVHTGKGLTNVSVMDKAIWGEFGNKREELFGGRMIVQDLYD
jgi:5-methylcytosine-specific restriction protein A